jgi:tetratricopeptide (TPR) repeat protein
MTGAPPPPRAAVRQAWLERIDAALRGQGMPAAAALSIQALAEGVEHPAVLNLAASARHEEGRYEEAVELLKRARKLSPQDPHVLNSLGICLKALGRLPAALEAYDAALRADPRMAAAHCNRASVLEDLNDITAAKAAYERAVALDRNYAEPQACLAWLAAQNGEVDAARAQGERALRLAPGHVLARMALASADLQARDLEGAEARLAELQQDPSLGPVNRSIVQGLIGDLRDAQGRPAEAFAAYEGSNAEMQALHAPRFARPGQESALDHARRLAAWFEAADPAPWREAPPARPRAADPAVHVFLVGFPRSGTTLLENVMAAHPQVISLEEKDGLAQGMTTYLATNEGLEKLARISPGEAVRQRDAYWSAVRSFGVEPRGRVFIDKMPLSSINLPLIAKLFPNARILFARRDPRDVVLSCFRRRFGMNASMYQLLTLDGAAAYYDAVMRLAELYRDLLPLPQHLILYESLVEDFDQVASGACAFLGLEWDEGLRDFAAKARTRGITTPSAAQVARGLNREGQGAWRRYKAQMAPVLPLLRPWVDRFGYPAD